MFSSTSNTLMSPFPQFYFASSSSSFHQPPPPPPPPPPPILPNQNDNIFLHQNHPYDTLFSLSTAQIPNTLINLGVSNTTTTTTNIMTGTTSTTTKQLDDHRLIINNNNNAGLLQVAPNFLPKKSSAAAKKDRHSKIYTAQGLRDRRVRLSIDIAREFFDVHDMLGFDKASKTLEWLLTKSKKAIKELSRSKLKTTTNNITTTTTITTTTNFSASTNSECEQAVSEVNELTISADHNNNNNFINLQQDMSLSAPKSKGLNKKVDIEALNESALMNLLAKESRAKARARARARTKEKRHGYYTTTATTTSSYSINKRSHNVEKCGLSTQISNQFGTQAVPVGELDQDRSIRRTSPNSGLRDQDQREAEPDQDVMIKRKFRFPYSISSSGYNVAHHQGQFSGMSKCEASNNVVYSCPSLLLTPNWDNHSNSSSNSNNNNNNNNNVSTASLHPSFCLPT